MSFRTVPIGIAYIDLGDQVKNFISVPSCRYLPIFFCTGIFASIEAIRSNTVVVQQFPDQVGEVSGRIQSYTSAAMLGAPWLAAVVIPHVSLPLLLIGDGVLGFIALALVAGRFRALAGRATGGADDAVIARPPQTPA